MEIKSIENPTSQLFKIIEEIERKAFPVGYQKGRLTHEAQSHRGVVAHLASIDGQPVGFKIGYQLKEKIFYSWLGGVLPEFRRRGVARALMKEQHQSIKSLGYEYVRTNSRNANREMMILSLQFGFDIIGTHFVHDEGRLSIHFEKRL